jgi:hypothetical protein
MTFDEFLAHYGVKGMRWGVRRSEKQLARARAERSGKVPIQKSNQFLNLPEEERKALGTELRKISDKKANEQFRKDLRDPKSRVSRALQEQTGRKGSAVDIVRAETKASKKAAKTRKKKDTIRKLSDGELQARIKRLESERKLGELEKSEGQKIAEDILKGAGSKAGKAVVAGAAVYGAKLAAEMIVGKDLASNIPKIKKA